jgi:phosphatidylserine/phosphatidylglycerophosphate/cardiolipin synthase-like enzyme
MIARTADRLVFAVEQRRAAFLEAIRSARSCLRLSMFRCNDFHVMDALGEALGRGVSVELLLTRRAKGWEKKIRNIGLYLESMGTRVNRYALKGVKYHAKYLVVDSRSALVASLNLTRKSFDRTADFLLATEDDETVGSLCRLFEHDANSPASPLPDNLSARLIIGPDNARDRFRDLIGSARQSLQIIDHRISDPEMLALLERKRAEGVTIEVFGKGALASHKSHGKAMVIDGAVAVVGSISLSTPSLGSRREVSIVIDDEECVAQLRGFLTRYGTASELQTAPGVDEDDEEEPDEE